MELPTEVFGDVIVVHTPEELNNDAAKGLVTFVESLPKRNIVLDLDGTELVDNTGLEAILDSMDSMREMAGDLKISTANSVNRKILEVTRLDSDLEVYSSVIDAVKSFV